MLAGLNYPDAELISDRVRGFPLSGSMPTSGVFPHGVRQPTLTELQNNTAWAVDSLFGLLGLDYAREGAKPPEFSAVFKMLGVRVDTSKAQQGEISVGHTTDRKLGLGQALEETLLAKKLSTKMAERLRGGWFSTNALGQVAQQTCS